MQKPPSVDALAREITGVELPQPLLIDAAREAIAAGLLVLAALARNRGVVVSRGELVEIGGGFRVPEVMEQSGATLVEVGTTNRTHLDDYRASLAGDPAVILKVHQSNYRIVGFTA